MVGEPPGAGRFAPGREQVVMSNVVEQYTIKPIPAAERYGSARGLFPFWFTAKIACASTG